MQCPLCGVQKTETLSDKIEALRNRIVKSDSYEENHNMVFGPNRLLYMRQHERELIKEIPAGFDFVHDMPIKEFHKAKLYKAVISYREGVYNVTRECNTDVVRTMPFGDLLLPECFLIAQQSGTCETMRVRCMRSIIDCVEQRKLDTSDLWKEAANVFELLVRMKNALKETLQTWFDSAVLDVLMIIIDKCVSYVYKVMVDPWKHVPTVAEGTIIGAYIHARRPIVMAAGVLDWLDYQRQVAVKKLENPYAISELQPSYTFTKHVYENFLATPTKIQRKLHESKQSIPLQQFVFNCGMIVSKGEYERKQTDPDVVRDTLMPVLLSCAAVTSFIPRFCANFSSMYVQEEVGYMVSVDEIRELDKKQAQDWYSSKAEIMKQDVKVDSTIPFSELENIVNKNTVYVVDEKTRMMSCGLSPRNQFLLLPGHFVTQCMNDIIEVTKVPHSSSPGNAKFRFCLHEKLVTKLPGDIVLVYVSQHMDHMRTKDILKWFPEEPPVDSFVGRMLYKDRNGNVQTIDATEIEFHRALNNENVMWNNPKNPFEGYRYKAKTFQGLCGAPLINHTHKKSCILGLHVGGRTLDSTGVNCFVKRSELEKALSAWDSKCVIQESGISLQSYGVELYYKDVYFKNPVFDTTDRIDHVEVLGSTPRRTTRKSKVVYTPIYEAVKSRFSLDVDWGAPDFTFNGDKRHGARSLYKTLATKQVLKHPKILELAVEDYRNRIKTALDSNLEFWKSDMTILTDYEIVNGKSVRYVSGMNMSSKFDAHLPGPKSAHAKLVDGHWEFADYVWDEFNARESKMKKGILTYELLVNALKNEATKKSAVEVGKIRNFFMCGTPFQMVLRKYLQTTCRFYCYTTEYSECTVGINPHSLAWEKLFKEVSTFKSFLALDFKNFDLTSLHECISEGIDLIFFPRRYLFKLSQEELNVQKCIKHSIMHAICDINGDLMVLRDIIPSGINLTSILGCIINSLNFRMAYYFLNIGDVAFHQKCKLRTFGDDSFGSTNDIRFSVRNILYAFGEIGIQATDMHKNKVSAVKFYKLEEIEFLKRSGRYDPDFGVRVAPLVDSSRFKMLCCHVPTKHMSIEAVTGQCVDNFLLESTFHGRLVYDREVKIMREIAKEFNIERFCQTLNLTFDDRLKDWKSKYVDEALVTSESEKSSFSLARFVSSLFWNSQNWFEWTQEFKNFNTRMSVGRHEDVKARLVRATNQDLSVLNKVELDELEYFGYEIESGVQKEQILSFVEKNEEEVLEIGGSVPEVRASDHDCSLAQFLARPVKIATWPWGSTLFAQQIDPWNELFNNKRIANRISNYKLFRGKCMIKIVVNGNGFYYGKLMVSYLPFQQNDYRSQFATTEPLNRICMSQCPHVFVDATTSCSCTMALPFFYPMDYVSLQDTDQRRSLGSLGFYQIAPLRHANQDIAVTLNNLSVTVYAWFEDVELVGPTHVNIQGISAQAGTEDEEVSKPVSQACTAVASAARHLAKLPVIGPYALAIEQGANLTATVASALGYSNPLDCVEPSRMQPRMLGNTCVANTTDSAMKLSLDVKQDTTIDPTTVGLSSKDELSIQHVASRESFINTFDWQVSQSANTLLYNYRVTPMMYTTVNPGITNYISAICGATIPFTFWNGSIVFKFQVICSANHKGRLAVVYDPNYTADGAALESNVAYMEIVDISENREFEVTINNHQPIQWMRIPAPWYGLVDAPHSSTRFNSFTFGSNGTLSIYVLNELTSPASDPTIGDTVTIAAYIKAGDDYQVANPSGKMAAYFAYVPESGISEVVDSNVDIEHQMRMKEHQMRVYQGEAVESFRMLLKRYQNYMRVSNIGGIDTVYNTWYIVHQGFPAMRGMSDGIPYPGSNTVGYTYLQYLMGAYSGWKGGIRWKFLLDLPDTNFMVARRDLDITVPYTNVRDITTTPAGKAIEFAAQGNESTTFGGVWSNTSVNPSVEIELPFYSQYKFVAGKPYSINQGFFDAYSQHFQVTTQKSNVTDTTDHSISVMVSAGEDFTLFFFSGFPPIDCYLL
jgi:hypothetical protein